jgi:hypothetical protein
MAIVYALICREKTVLAEYTATSGEYCVLKVDTATCLLSELLSGLENCCCNNGYGGRLCSILEKSLGSRNIHQIACALLLYRWLCGP